MTLQWSPVSAVFTWRWGAAVARHIENDLGEYLQTVVFFPSTLIKQCKSYQGQGYL